MTSLSECGCSVVGSNSSQCNQTTGDCLCNTGVMGRTCDFCQVCHYSTTVFSHASLPDNDNVSRKFFSIIVKMRIQIFLGIYLTIEFKILQFVISVLWKNGQSYLGVRIIRRFYWACPKFEVIIIVINYLSFMSE